MKNYFKLSKLAALIFVVVISISCEKSEPEPPLADQLMGSYLVTSYKAGSTTINLPATTTAGVTLTAKITGIKVSDEVASFTFILTQSKSGISTSSNVKLENLALKKASDGSIEGYKGTSKEVSWQNNILMLILTDPDPNKVLTIFANKE